MCSEQTDSVPQFTQDAVDLLQKQATMEKTAVYPATVSRGDSCRDSESVLCPKRTDTNLSIHALKHSHEHAHSFPWNDGR